ncbi:YqzL family protein [Caloranaerobacter azorensis]|uniref:YqzL family protein n=1 Tax=Caloranaerobacter azorensis TaxID=116090 RepID=A0A6P1YAT4_9FIRM|nr:YqzL family protein [Caloranaerobacter azorensis]QIB26301.1 YqzL family protein [Caloranaerobacter azorensis]
MLRNEMWKIFQATGNINAFIYCKECEKIVLKQKEDGYKEEIKTVI